MIPDLTPEEIARFYSKVLRGDGCWPYRGEKHKFGYGLFTVYRDGKRVRILAHRLAFKLATGADPGSSVVRHRCDNPPCCNPEDLEPGTQADNVADAVERRRTDVSGLREYVRARDERALRRLETGEKQCSHCWVVKTLDDFFRATANVDGRAYWCKECVLEHQRKYRKRLKQQRQGRKDVAA